MQEGNALENEITGGQVQDQGRFMHRILRAGNLSKIATTPVAPEAETQPVASGLAGNREIYSQIENWSAYKEIKTAAEKNLMTGCYNDLTGEPLQDLDEAIAKLESGKMYRLVLPGDYDLIYTPRGSFPVEQFMDSVCGELGSMFLAHAYDDKLLWMQGGCGGVAYSPDEDPDGTLTKQLNDCDLSSKVVTDFFSK